MRLDGPTLLVTLVITAALAGGLLLWVWLQDRRIQALKWWGVSYFAAAAGLTLAVGRDVWPDRVTIDLASALVFAGGGSMWVGTRAFAAKKTRPVWSLSVAAVWLLACQVPAFYASLPARAIFASVLFCILLLVVAREFILISDPLPSRLPLAIVAAVHGLFFVARLVGLAVSPEPMDAWNRIWFPATSLEGILFAFASGFLLLAMAKSRLEMRHRLAAEQDYLTNAANRRGFYAQAGRALTAARLSGRSTALVVFDLNRFKQINDTHGHQSGDRVLRLFGSVARDTLRKSDIFGRLGGDEFAALLADTTEDEAEDIAERMATRFSESARKLAGLNFQVSASIGIACSPESLTDLDELIDQADRALYQNRLEAQAEAEEQARA
jgi:diguanylate cyclase (GGDEF)-like protein